MSTSIRARGRSAGYSTVSILERGVYRGQPYTHRQKNIRYNHVCLTDSGRGGTQVSVLMDSSDFDRRAAIERLREQNRQRMCDAWRWPWSCSGPTILLPEQIADLLALQALQNIEYPLILCL
ncbi:DUF2213 domain-containing protein [Gloeobacter kilaueensis]|uniref:DUF2213 domain-containing protein n=1 Tax=Gloeobacter kilaueensis TaxID=1416614 RepID=UPI001651090E|nr:DUF2213 domain-containing protein [Gloeobacter kilaueensis]